MRRALASLWLITLAACTGELPEADSFDRLSDTVGSLQIRLSGTDASGRRYQLQKATFELSGTAMLTLSTAGDAPRAKALSTPLPSGAYQLFLRPGYEVVELGSDGAERTIAAKLKSQRPLLVSVVARTDQRVALCFSASDRDISFGSSADLSECQVGAGPLAQAR
ncbi:MAG TPA: hypothetical protein VFZ61_31710 [Polyangiales bacterium]